LLRQLRQGFVAQFEQIALSVGGQFNDVPPESVTDTRKPFTVIAIYSLYSLPSLLRIIQVSALLKVMPKSVGGKSPTMLRPPVPQPIQNWDQAATVVGICVVDVPDSATCLLMPTEEPVHLQLA
jgi:hypothetical protein